MSYWRNIAKRTIAAAIETEPPGEDYQKRVKAAIDQSYPFGARQNHPYKIWLDERRKAFYSLGILKPQQIHKGKHRPCPGHDRVSPGQTNLFEGQQ